MNLTPEMRKVVIEAARQEAAVRSLAGFVRYMWPISQGVALEWGPHLDLMCQELEWLAEGRARCMDCWDREPGCDACDGTGFVFVNELVINIPPGHGKSWIGSVYFPAWLWLRDPALYLLSISNKDDLASRDARRMRNLVMHDRYQTLVTRQAIIDGRAVVKGAEVLDAATGAPFEPWGLASDQKTKVNFENTRGGGRNSGGMTGAITGQRCRGLIVDDPSDAKEVMLGDPARVSERMREVRTIYHGALRSRLNKGAWRLVIMQRLHQSDLAGDRIARPDRGTRVVCLPVRYNPDHPQAHPGDNRERGAWLCEAAFSQKEEDDLRKGMTPRHYRAQYQQEPTADEGGKFRRRWFDQRYQGAPMVFAAKARFEWMEIVLDCTFKNAKDSDYVAAQVWGWKRKDTPQGCAAGRYLLDRRRDRMDLIDTCQMLKDLKGKWPQVNRVTVEDKANGPAVISTMKRNGHEKIVEWSPDKHGSKVARAEVSAVSFEAGDVWLPDPEHAPWVADYIEEHVGFPAAPNDDEVDATSMLMIRWDEMAGQGADINAGLQWADLL